MIELTKEEFAAWRSQTVTSKSVAKGLRYPPFAFTEQGFAMLSSVLNSKRAIEINILIMRAFVKLRELISTNKRVEAKLKDLEDKFSKQGKQIVQIVQAIQQLTAPPKKSDKRIGF